MTAEGALMIKAVEPDPQAVEEEERDLGVGVGLALIARLAAEVDQGEIAVDLVEAIACQGEGGVAEAFTQQQTGL